MGKLTLQSLVALPSFLFSVTVFYWSLPLMAMLHRLPFLRVRGPRNDAFDWGKNLMLFFRVTVLQYGSQGLYKEGHPLYLANHRSWADFFVDVYLTQGRAALMSRWMVFVAFPVFCSAVIVLKGILFFKRGTILDREKFNRWLDEKLASNLVPGFMVYPEGHRNIKPHSLPLKRGMLAYGYSRKLPVQIIITRDKERVLSEKTMTAHYGVTLVTGFSKVIDPSKFAKYEDFIAGVQTTWDALWAEVYGADASSLPEHKPDEHVAYAYPASMRLAMGTVCVASIPVMGCAMYATWWALSLLLQALGSWQQVFVAAAAVWIALSMWSSWAPSSSSASSSASASSISAPTKGGAQQQKQ